jgi:hypothetical protein
MAAAGSDAMVLGHVDTIDSAKAMLKDVMKNIKVLVSYESILHRDLLASGQISIRSIAGIRDSYMDVKVPDASDVCLLTIRYAAGRI